MKKHILFILIIGILTLALTSGANIDLGSATQPPTQIRPFSSGTMLNNEFNTTFDFDLDGYIDSIILCSGFTDFCDIAGEPYCEGGPCYLKVTLSCGSPLSNLGISENGVYIPLYEDASKTSWARAALYGNTYYANQEAINGTVCGIAEPIGFFSADGATINPQGAFPGGAGTIAQETWTVYLSDYSLNEAPNITGGTTVQDDVRSTEVFTFDVSVTDADDDPLTYEWSVDGVPVSTSPSYDFDAGIYDAGTYTVEVVVSDGTANDTTSWSIEVRAKGGSASSVLTGMAVTEEVEEPVKEIIITDLYAEQEQNVFERFWLWLRGLFR